MMKIILDTSVLIGVLDNGDMWHNQAVALLDALAAIQAIVEVPDCVLAETISTLSRRSHERRRAINLDQLIADILAEYPPETMFWTFPDVPVLYPRIVEMVRASKGELGFNDALLAISCQRRAIHYIASFDRDFDTIPWLRRVAQPSDLDESVEF